MSKARYIADFIVSSNDIANSTITYVDIGTIFTSNIFENGDTTSGNLYFTNARVDARIASTSINALVDVDITGVSVDQTLVWTGTNWVPGSPIVGATGFSNTSNFANVSNFSNVANLVLSLERLTTSNLAEGSNLYYTNARVDARFLTTSINALVDVDITGITTNQVLFWDGNKFVPTFISTTGFSNTANFANVSNFSNVANLVLSLEGLTTSNLAEGSNLYYTNTRVYANVIDLLQYYTGNISAGNVTITGKFVGDGSALTGIGSFALAGMATYGGNILAANITANTVTAINVYANSFISTGSGIPTLQSGTSINLTANNAVVITNSVFRVRSYSDTDRDNNTIPQSGDVIFNSSSNVLQYYSNGQWISSGNATALISSLTTTNVNEGSNLYYTNARVLTGVTTGNISNLTVTNNIIAGSIYGTFIGDGSGLTGIVGGGGSSPANLALLATYNGNILASNITAKTITTSNITVGNILTIGGLITAGEQNNTVILGGIFRSIFDELGNVILPNLVVQGKLFGNGSSLTGITLDSLDLDGYVGNISATNVTATQFIVTPALYLGSNSLSNNRITATSSDNTIVRHGIYSTQFLTNGNVVTTGKFVGDGSGLTNLATGSLLSGIATYDGNILASNITATNISTSNLYVSNIINSVGATVLSVTVSNNTTIKAGPYTSQFLDNGNVLLPNVVAGGKYYGDGSALTGITVSLSGLATYNGNILASNITANSISTGVIRSSAGNISSIPGQNTVIFGGSYASTFADTGNVILPNLVVQGKIFGDGTGITGISVASLGLATYGGNILASNITTTTLTTNSLISSFGNISALTGTNTIIFGGSYASTFGDTGNVTVPNIVVQGKIFGDGSAITGITLASFNIATYTGNISAGNITASQFIVTPALYLGSNSSSNTRISSTSSDNTIVRHGIYSTQFLSTGNVITTGKFIGDGSGLSGVIASANLSTLSVYNGNVLASNIFVTNFLVTPNLILGNSSVSNSRITFTNSDNTAVRHGSYTTQFLTNGNVVTSGKFVGDGSGLTNLATGALLSGMATYGGNVLAANVTATTLNTTNLYVSNIINSTGVTVLSVTVSNNTSIKAGPYTSQFLDNGNVLLPNVIVSGKFYGDGSGITGITASLSGLATYNGNILAANITANSISTGTIRSSAGNISAIPGQNTIIFGGVYASTFSEDGNVTLPNVIIQGRLSGNGSGLTGISVSSLNLPGYGGNILATNVTTTFLTTNTLIASFGNITALGGANTVIFGGSYASTFADTGNVILPNLVVQGKIFGDGSGLTGISLASLNLATYAGNVLGRNVTATEFIVTPNLIIGNNSSSNSRITFNTSDNTAIRHGIYFTQFLINGNISTTGRFVGDGSGLSNISTAGLNLPTYGGNILVANLFASQFIVTPNLIIGNTSVSNSRITFNTSDNTIIRHGSYTTQFLTNGNLVTNGKFVGDGSGLTGVLTSIGSIATYGGNILANNVTANIVYTNVLTGRTGNANISLLAGDNTLIFGGIFPSRFDDTGNVTFPNVIVSGRASGLWVGNVNSANVVATTITASVISFGSSANLSSRADNNTIISTGSYNTTFRDSGTIETTNVWVSTGLYVGSQALNNIISTSSRGSGTTTTYIGNQSITTSSDIRLKNILGNTTIDAVNVVSNLRVVDYTWNDPSDTSFNNKNARGTWTGLVAQEVINIVPYVVNAVRDSETLLPIPNAKNEQGKDIYWGMEYDKLVPLLIRAVQEQQFMIDNLNARILALESNK